MKGRTIVPVILVLGLAPVGCDDDDTVTAVGPSVLYGSWEVTRNEARAASDEGVAKEDPRSITDETRFIHFRPDHTYHLLEATTDGFRSIRGGVFLISGGQVDLGADIYNFSVHGDALTLSRPERTLSASRAEDAPAASDWIEPMTSIVSLVAPADVDADLTWDGSYLWLGNGYSSDELYRIDPQQLAVVSTLPTTRSAWGLCWHEGSLWSSDDGSDNIYELDPVTGLTLSTSPDMGAWIPGIASDGSHLWCVSSNEHTIYRYDPAANAIHSTIELDTHVEPGGAVHVHGFLFVSAFGTVHQCATDPFAVVAAYGMEGRSIAGITFDDTSFWVVTDGESGGYRIHKVEFQRAASPGRPPEGTQ